MVRLHFGLILRSPTGSLAVGFGQLPLNLQPSLGLFLELHFQRLDLDLERVRVLLERRAALSRPDQNQMSERSTRCYRSLTRSSSSSRRRASSSCDAS